jgi:hypothetical protein
LSISSIFVHSCIFEEDLEFQNNLILVDKTIIGCIFIYGGYLYWNSLKKTQSYFPLMSFLIVIWYYIGGCLLGKYCFDPDEARANVYHTVIHIIGSLGHHSIISEYVR